MSDNTANAVQDTRLHLLLSLWNMVAPPTRRRADPSLPASSRTRSFSPSISLATTSLVLATVLRNNGGWVVQASCDADHYGDADCNDAMVTYSNAGNDDDFGMYGMLVVYSLITVVLGWIALLHPFFFVPKFQSKVRGYVNLGNVRKGSIISMRRGKVSNPLRFCLPTRHNCYVTVSFDPNGSTPLSAAANSDTTPPAATAVPPNEDEPSTTSTNNNRHNSTIRKELVIEEDALQLLMDRSSDTIDVYTAGPSYPLSGMLNDQYQGHRITLPVKIFYAIGGFVLIAVALTLSFYVTADHIYSSEHMWKFWSVLVGHILCLGLAYWSCHFVYRKRIEALLYGTIDDGTAAYGRCGIASMEKGDMGADGVVDLPLHGAGTGAVIPAVDTGMSSASMNSLEAGSGPAGAMVAAGAAANDKKGGAGDEYHAMA